MQIAIHQTVPTQHLQLRIQLVVPMALVITLMEVQQPEQRVAKRTIFPSLAHQIQLCVSKKNRNQFLLTMQILFTKISGKNMILKMRSIRAHNNVFSVGNFAPLRAVKSR